MSLTSPIDTFTSGTFAVARRANGARVDGLYVDGATTNLLLDLSIQPVTGRDLRAVPSGYSAEDVRLVLTKAELRAKDVVTYKGESWTVYQSQDWTHRGTTWFEALMSRDAAAPVNP